MPQFKLYTEESNPLQHVKYYSQAMILYQHGDAIYQHRDALICRIFSANLGECVQDWFQHPKPNSISSFNQLVNELISGFTQCLPEDARTNSLLVWYKALTGPLLLTPNASKM